MNDNSLYLAQKRFVSGADGVSIAREGTYCFTGTGAKTWNVAGINPSSRQFDRRTFIVKNESVTAGVLTLASTTSFFTTAAVSTVTVAAGNSVTIVQDNQYLQVL